MGNASSCLTVDKRRFLAALVLDETTVTMAACANLVAELSDIVVHGRPFSTN